MVLFLWEGLHWVFVAALRFSLVAERVGTTLVVVCELIVVASLVRQHGL